MVAASSLYDVLAVDPGASSQALKSAYWRAARRTHPDTLGGSAAAFHEVQQAWTILGDPAARRRYDQRTATSRPAARAGQEPLSDWYTAAQADAATEAARRSDQRTTAGATSTKAPPRPRDPRQRPVWSPDQDGADGDHDLDSDEIAVVSLPAWAQRCPAWLLTPQRMGRAAAAGGGLSLAAAAALVTVLSIGNLSTGLVVLVSVGLLYLASAVGVRRAPLPGVTAAEDRLVKLRRCLYAFGGVVLALWLLSPGVLGPLVWGGLLLLITAGSHLGAEALIARRQLLAAVGGHRQAADQQPS